MRTRAALIQVASHAALSATSAFIAILAVELGASLAEVGLLVAGYQAALLVSSLFAGRAADQYGRRRMVQLGLGLAALAAGLHALATSPLALGGARVVFGFAAGLYPPALTSLAYDQNRKLGRFTAWGSLGYTLGTLAAGLLAATDLLGGYSTSVFVFAALMLALAFGLSLLLSPRPELNVKVPLFPRAVIARNLPAYSALLLRHVGASAAWAVFPLFLFALGADLTMVAIVSMVNGIAQFAAMQFVDRFPSGRLVVAGLAMSALTFVLFALAQNLLWILVVQLLLGASWAALYTGALKFVMERNVERATSTGLLQSTLQLSHVAGPLWGGLFAQAFGFPALMLVAAGLSLLGIPAFLYELHRHPSFLDELPAEHPHAVPAKRADP